MTLQEARAIAAQCWCDPETSHIEMDVNLAEAFAKRLNVVFEQRRCMETLLDPVNAVKSDPPELAEKCRESYRSQLLILNAIIQSWNISNDSIH